MVEKLKTIDYTKWGLVITVVVLALTNLFAWSGTFTHIIDRQNEHGNAIRSMTQHNGQVDTKLDTLNDSVIRIGANVDELKAEIEGRPNAPNHN